MAFAVASFAPAKAAVRAHHAAPAAAAPMLPRVQLLQHRRAAAVARPFAAAAAAAAAAPRRRAALFLLRAGPDAAPALPDDFDPASLPEEERLCVDFDYLGDKIKAATDALEPQLKGCSIYLIGMMGSGKSTVGRMLANTLKYAFFDTDAVIEKAHPGMTVADIFKEHGEEYFRRCEAQVGGGSFLSVAGDWRRGRGLAEERPMNATATPQPHTHTHTPPLHTPPLPLP